MIIEETFTIDAPIQQVWDFFFDLDRMSKCVPGAQATQLDASNYEGALQVKVGPIGATFSGSVAITSQTPPTAMEATLKAKDTATGSIVQGKFTSALQAVSPGQTEIHYIADVTIRGKLGQFGQTVIQDTARRLSGEFLTCIKAYLERPEGAPEPTPMTQRRAGCIAVRAVAGALLAAIARWFKQLFRRKPGEGQSPQ
jgi:hypothetical protein